MISVLIVSRDKLTHTVKGSNKMPVFTTSLVVMLVGAVYALDLPVVICPYNTTFQYLVNGTFHANSGYFDGDPCLVKTRRVVLVLGVVRRSTIMFYSMLRLSNKLDAKEEKKKTRKKITAEDRVKFELTKAQLMGIRAVKKSLKAKPLGAFSEEVRNASGKAGKKKTKKKQRKPGFEDELADISAPAVKKFRAGPSYKERKEAAEKSGKVYNPQKNRRKTKR